MSNLTYAKGVHDTLDKIVELLPVVNPDEQFCLKLSSLIGLTGDALSKQWPMSATGDNS